MPSRRAQSLCGLLIALAVGRPLGAQGIERADAPGRTPARVRSVVEIGATAVRFPDDGTTVIGPSAFVSGSWERGSLFAGASGAGVVSGAGGTGAATMSGGARWPLGAGWFTELGTELSGVAGSDSRLSRSATLSPRILRAFADAGAWIRASGSVAGRELGAMWGRSVDAGAWWQRGPAVVRASVLREWSAGQLFVGPGRGEPIAVVPVHFDEAAVATQLDGDAADFSFVGSVRRDPDADRRYDVALSGEAVVWRTATIGFTIAAARQLPDFIHGADAMQYLSVGVRWAGGRPRSPIPPSAARPVLSVQPEGDSLLLRVRAPGARRVEVIADFTEWEPIELAANGGAFVRRLKLAPGTYHALIRVDGGDWKPAANTPAVDDDLGGRVGLVVIP